MTPEEAYKITEKKWRAIAGGELSIDPSSMANCGLCLFAREAAGRGALKLRCNSGFCPVPPAFGCPCDRLPILQECVSLCEPRIEGDILEEYLGLAREVLEQLTIHKEQLIAEMERIRGEK